jgi:hypothetical protein
VQGMVTVEACDKKLTLRVTNIELAPKMGSSGAAISQAPVKNKDSLCAGAQGRDLIHLSA